MRGWLAALILLAWSVMPLTATPRRPAPPVAAAFAYGVSWYPEQFPESSWDADLALMRKAHVTYVRVAEFSWSTLEPTEDHYDFAWLDRAIAHAAAAGIHVLIGTPTAAPPAWLTDKYPDVLAMEADGRRAQHGWRRQFSVGSARYRRLAAGIAERLAERYGRDPNVIGFQIDNEYGRDTHDPETRTRFQDWLKARYGTIADYNRRQFNRYWSLDYDDWRQIDIPGEKAQPQLRLDWLRFFSDMWAGYQQAQIDAMRPHLGADKILTTNYVAKYDEFDFSVPAQALDVVGWDWYFETPLLDPAEGATLHDLYRGFLDRAPWVLETAPGHMNWAERNYTEPRGELHAMAWQAVAHGADGYAFWAWRPPLNGTETDHGMVVDAGGRPNPVYQEIAATGAELAKAWPALRGSKPVAQVAMLYDYPSRWAIESQALTKDYDPWTAVVRTRAALMPVTDAVDVRGSAADLARYRLVVAPDLHLVSAATAAQLAAYVRGGGHLLIGPRAGVRDEDNSLWQQPPLEGLAGVRVDLAQTMPHAVALSGPLGPASARIWAERLTPAADDVEVLLRYGTADGWLDGQPGVVSRRVGKGRITYVGAWLDEPALRRLVRWSATQAGVAANWPGLAPQVEIASRSAGDHIVHVAINWGETPQRIALPRPMHDLLHGGIAAAVTLPRFGIAVLEEMR